ncbi:MAG: hypothetical protein WCJ39_03655 [bacterium]
MYFHTNPKIYCTPTLLFAEIILHHSCVLPLKEKERWLFEEFFPL